MRSVQDQVVSAAPARASRSSPSPPWPLAAAVSVGLGWLFAGRMLRPLQEIASAARHASASTLHERIALQGPNDELRELADTFDAMLEPARGSLRTRSGEFVPTPRTSCVRRWRSCAPRSKSPSPTRGPRRAELRAMADTVRTAIARSEDIIDKLLILAESERLVENEAVDMGEVLSDAVGRYAAAGKARDLTFALALAAAPVRGDRALLECLVDNLVENAVKYATAASVVEASVAVARPTVTLRVANDGEVIAADELPHLFERFYRRGTSRSRRDGGAGLGMAIVAAVAQVHGGTVTAEGPPGGGLVVTVALPHGAAVAAERRDAARQA